MARQCIICNHPKRDEIESLQSLKSLREIATQFNVSKDCLCRHYRQHTIPSVLKPNDTQKRDKAPSDRAIMERKQGVNIPKELKPGVQSAFLAAFIELANETGACRSVQIDRSTVRYWEEHDETFSMRYQDAKDQVNDDIRAEIHRRSVLGYDDTLVTNKGETVVVTKYSDRLLEFWAKARMRSEFGDKAQVEMSGPGGGPIQHEQSISLDVRNMSAEDLTALRVVLERANSNQS